MTSRQTRCHHGLKWDCQPTWRHSVIETEIAREADPSPSVFNVGSTDSEELIRKLLAVVDQCSDLSPPCRIAFGLLRLLLSCVCQKLDPFKWIGR